MMPSPLPYQDFTLKARVQDAEAIRQKLHGLGATHVGLDEQTDTYFQTQRGKLKWRKGTIENLITHYERVNHGGIEKTIVYRYDVNPGPAAVEALLSTAPIIGTVVKTRSIYRLQHLKIHLDQQPGDLWFLEVEAQDATQRVAAETLRADCEKLFEALGICPADRLRTGYFTPE